MSLTRKIIITILSFSIIVSALIVDNNFFRKGWELPKLSFWQSVILLVGLIAVVLMLYRIFRGEIKILEIIRRNRFVFFIIFIFLLYFIFFLLNSNFARNPDSLSHNPIYSTIVSALNPKITISLFGNEFRDFGMITLGLVLLFLIILVKTIDIRSYKFLPIALVVSSTIQAIIGISQLFRLLSINPNIVLNGDYIYGSFGQPNFYAGHVLVGCLILLVVILKNNIYFKSKLQVIFRAFLTYLFILNFIGLVISFSYWGIFCFFVGFVLILLNHIATKDKFSKYLKIFIVVFSIVFIPLAILLVNIFKFFEQRIIIWKDIYFLYTGQSNSTLSTSQILFGTGPDSLGEVLSVHGKMAGQYVDRGHNIIMDILSSFGFFGLFIFIALFLYLTYRVINSKNKNLNYIFIIFLVLFIRLLVNTYSIVNIIDFIVILAGCLIALKSLGISKQKGAYSN